MRVRAAAALIGFVALCGEAETGRAFGVEFDLKSISSKMGPIGRTILESVKVSDLPSHKENADPFLKSIFYRVPLSPGNNSGRYLILLGSEISITFSRLSWERLGFQL